MHIGCLEEAQYVSEDGRYYKKSGQFWFVYQQGGWHAVSGEPVSTKLTLLGRNNAPETSPETLK